MIPGRLLPLHAGGPAENMAVDQALLESVDRGAAPTLRFYAWDQPTLSLGYFQRLADRQRHAESEPLACVRRATGGGAIIHHHELTYSLAFAAPGASPGGRVELYHRVHQAAIDALRAVGVVAAMHEVAAGPLGDPASFLCFQRRTNADLVVGGYKVLGSAQRRGRLAVLQHGSLLVSASRFAPQLPGVSDLASRRVRPDQLAAELAGHLSRVLAVTWSGGELSGDERRRAAEIERSRFAASAWHRRR